MSEPRHPSSPRRPGASRREGELDPASGWAGPSRLEGRSAVERQGSDSGAASRGLVRCGVPEVSDTGAERRAGTSNVRDGVVVDRVSLPGERQPSSLRTLRSRPNPPPSGASPSRRGARSVVRHERVSVATPPSRQVSRGVAPAPRLGRHALCPAGGRGGRAGTAIGPSRGCARGRSGRRKLRAGVRRSGRRGRAGIPDPGPSSRTSAGALPASTHRASPRAGGRR